MRRESMDFQFIKNKIKLDIYYHKIIFLYLPTNTYTFNVWNNWEHYDFTKFVLIL